MASKATTTRIAAKRSPVKGKPSANLGLLRFSKKAQIIIFVLLFANIGVIGLLVARAATAGLTYSNESDQFNKINNYRKSNGRVELGRSACLSGIARGWAMQMGQKQKLAHSSDTGSGIYGYHLDFSKQVPAQCGSNWKKLGENVGVGYTSSSLFTAFTNSASHRANILDLSYDYVGVGAYISSDGRLWIAQVFADCPSCSSAYTRAPRSIGEPGSNLRDTMTGGQRLSAGQRIYAKNGSYDLVMQSDGNLVIYRYWGGAIWSSRTYGSTNAYAIFQTDSNFVVYRSGKYPCHSGTYGKGGRSLIMQGDANLVMYTGTGSAVWASKSSPWYC